MLESDESGAIKGSVGKLSELPRTAVEGSRIWVAEVRRYHRRIDSAWIGDVTPVGTTLVVPSDTRRTVGRDGPPGRSWIHGARDKVLSVIGSAACLALFLVVSSILFGIVSAAWMLTIHVVAWIAVPVAFIWVLLPLFKRHEVGSRSVAGEVTMRLLAALFGGVLVAAMLQASG